MSRLLAIVAALTLFGTHTVGAVHQSRAAAQTSGRSAAVDSWAANFDVDRADLVSTGRNDHFILEPGYTAVFESGAERLVITVLNETRRVDGVDTRVVEERETRNGAIVEVSRNYFAISRRTHDVYYFGEDVDAYSGGKIENHDGSWMAGVNGARFGLAMPGDAVHLNRRYYQEIAPRVAMDRATIVGVAETVTAPAGEFRNCLKTEETTPLEPGVKEYKYYARGIGLVQDGSLKLVKYPVPAPR
jgi:hypothetical protein